MVWLVYILKWRYFLYLSEGKAFEMDTIVRFFCSVSELSLTYISPPTILHLSKVHDR